MTSLCLGKASGGTDYFYFLPREDDLPPHGTTFAVDLICLPSNPDRDRQAAFTEACRVLNALRAQRTTRGSDWPCVMTGHRQYWCLHAFPMPLVPAGQTLRFVVPMVRLRFFPEHEDQLPLSH